MKEKIIALIDEFGLNRIKEEVINMMQNSIRINTIPKPDEEIKIGESKFGGFPDLPVNLEWPKNGEGEPLAFIGQINFEDVFEYDLDNHLPSEGILFLFWDVGMAEGKGNPAKVIYYKGDFGELKRLYRKADKDDKTIFLSCILEFQTEISIPDFESNEIELLELDEDEEEAYYDFYDEVEALYDKDFDYIHRMLGYPYVIQNAVYFNEDDDQNTRLLLQVDSDDNANMMWGDAGIIYFLIDEDDLSVQDFSKVQGTSQTF